MVALMESPPNPETIIDGVPYLYFGGTGYLGLASRPEVIEAGCEAMRRYGVHSATTRARIGTNPPVRDTERNAAAYFGTEAAFYFGSGYVANHIMLAALCEGLDALLIDEGAHYCLLEAARASGLPVLPFHHRDPADLARHLGNHRRVLVTADAVCPSTGETAPVLDYLEVLRSRSRAVLLLDDAHGFGILGPNGRGLLDELDLWDGVNRAPDAEGIQLYVCGTLAKALGGFGGIIPGTADFIARVRTSSHYFDGASAPASAVAGASAKALEILLRDPSHHLRLRDNADHLRAGLRKLGLQVPDSRTAHLGLSIGDAANMQRLHEQLKQRGIMLPYVGKYTGLPAQGVMRFAVFATHSTAQIDLLLGELASLL
jgi:7-keto-8-aminopelargonate synthetase-like enzyme